MKLGIFAVAVLAAVLDHQVVDILSSVGLFSGTHAEYEHLAVVPALVGAAMLLFVSGTTYWLDARRSDTDRSDWLAGVAGRLRSMPVAHVFAAIFLLQFCSLFAIESLEQFAAFGRIDVSFGWLGASVPVATLIGFVVAAAATALLRKACDVMHAAVAMIARIARALIVALGIRRRTNLCRPRAMRRPPFGGSGSLLASRSGLRAPPFA